MVQRKINLCEESAEPIPAKNTRPVRVLRAMVTQLLKLKNDNSLERRIGYFFRNPELLAQALIHRSWIVGRNLEYWQTNERLEFLGDSVLNMLVTEYLFKLFPTHPEGDLSKRKSAIVSGKALAEMARTWGLGPYLRIGKGEAKGGGRDKDSLLADAFESVIGAVFLDGGLDSCRHVLEKTLFPNIARILSDETFINYKSILLEGVQAKFACMPHYEICEEAGPEHQKEFHMQVFVNDRLVGKGTGASKKKAEQDAAREAVLSLGFPIQ
ncbi:MAG TPA: ribonuclease III [Fibrobacteraceae bacterium]|nr:ribonuclease III [Fibrobacteraceae bacterium]